MSFHTNLQRRRLTERPALLLKKSSSIFLRGVMECSRTSLLFTIAETPIKTASLGMDGPCPFHTSRDSIRQGRRICMVRMHILRRRLMENLQLPRVPRCCTATTSTVSVLVVGGGGGGGIERRSAVAVEEVVSTTSALYNVCRLRILSLAVVQVAHLTCRRLDQWRSHSVISIQDDITAIGGGGGGAYLAADNGRNGGRRWRCRANTAGHGYWQVDKRRNYMMQQLRAWWRRWWRSWC